MRLFLGAMLFSATTGLFMQTDVVAQVAPMMNSGCCDSSSYYRCRPALLPSLRGLLTPRACCRPAPRVACPAPCPQPVMRPRRVPCTTMVPQTCYMQQPYTVNVPVTTYQRMVVTVPRTEYRQMTRYRSVPYQVMVPRTTYSTVWEPRYRRPGCFNRLRSRIIAPYNYPGYSGVGMGYPATIYGGTVVNSPLIVPPQGGSTVPTAPQLTPANPQQNQKVPNPEPDFQPRVDDQASMGPMSPVQSRNRTYHESESDGYRTIRTVPIPQLSSGTRGSSPSASSVWRSQLR